MNTIEPEDLHNFASDNLFDPEDDHDENDCFNWGNNPLRQVFDNHRQSSERSTLIHEDTEDTSSQ
jgi:hypothetical protein